MEIHNEQDITKLDLENLERTSNVNHQENDDDHNEDGDDGVGEESGESVNWIQVSGHRGIFRPVRNGRRLWKRCVDGSRNESSIYRALSADPSMASLTPRFYGEIRRDADYYVEIENVLRHFKNPAILDIKMGTRTYVEAEVTNDVRSRDLYEKMISIDDKEATIDEEREKAITKLRYMQFRENLSSSSNLGFRIDAAKFPEETKSRNNFQRIKTTQQVSQKLKEFLRGRASTLEQLLQKLREIRETLATSHFFQTHELIGSSLLVVCDQTRTGVWMIDFHNTTPTNDGRSLSHVTDWQPGNHEDGYLLGLNNLIQILSDIQI